MFRFEEIQLWGFKSKEKIITLTFSDSPVTIIYGENGCGKTSLLKILHAILAQDETILLKEKVQKIKLTLSVNQIKKVIHIEKNVVLDGHDGIINDTKSPKSKERYNWDQLEEFTRENISSITFGVNRGITSRFELYPEQLEDVLLSPYIFSRLRNATRGDISHISLEICQRILNPHNNVRFAKRSFRNTIKRNAMLDNLNMETVENIIISRFNDAELMKIEKIQNALFDTLAKVINSDSERGADSVENILPSDFKELLDDYKEKLIEALNGINKNVLQEKIISILNNKDNDKIIEECLHNPILLTLIIKLIEELKNSDSVLESIDMLKNIFNGYISEGKYLEVDRNGVHICFMDSKETHNLDALSSGERHLLTILTIFLIEAQNRDVIMIDEPELSFNIRWQREILDILQKASKSTQIIVASHSPIIGRKHPEYLAKLV